MRRLVELAFDWALVVVAIGFLFVLAWLFLTAIQLPVIGLEWLADHYFKASE